MLPVSSDPITIPLTCYCGVAARVCATQVVEALRAAMEEEGAEVVLTRIAPGADPTEDSGASAGAPGAQRASSSFDTLSHGSTRVEIHGAHDPSPTRGLRRDLVKAAPASRRAPLAREASARAPRRAPSERFLQQSFRSAPDATALPASTG
jgi:hypothetical protein